MRVAEVQWLCKSKHAAGVADSGCSCNSEYIRKNAHSGYLEGGEAQCDVMTGK